MAKYRVTVDRSICVSCSVAPSTCPQVFVLGEDNGKTRLVDEYSEETSEDKSVGAVPEDLYDCVRQAAEGCPVQGISIEKIEG